MENGATVDASSFEDSLFGNGKSEGGNEEDYCDNYEEKEDDDCDDDDDADDDVEGG